MPDAPNLSRLRVQQGQEGGARDARQDHWLQGRTGNHPGGEWMIEAPSTFPSPSSPRLRSSSRLRRAAPASPFSPTPPYIAHVFVTDVACVTAQFPFPLPSTFSPALPSAPPSPSTHRRNPSN